MELSSKLIHLIVQGLFLLILLCFACVQLIREAPNKEFYSGLIGTCSGIVFQSVKLKKITKFVSTDEVDAVRKLP